MQRCRGAEVHELADRQQLVSYMWEPNTLYSGAELSCWRYPLRPASPARGHSVGEYNQKEVVGWAAHR